LLVSGGLSSGGKESQLIEVVKNLDKAKFECGIITFGINQHYSKQAKQLTSYYREIKKKPTRFEPLFTIWDCFREFKPEVVHVWDSLSSFYVWLPCKIHKIPMIDGSIRDAGVDKGFYFYFKRFFLKKAKIVISNSIAGLNAYRVEGHVIYNIINLSRFHPQLNENEFNMAMTANFTIYKDHETFLKAAVDLIQNKIVDQVYLFGDGPYRQKYTKWIYSNYSEIFNRFHFPGNIPNIEQHLCRCQIGVLCSTLKYSEGLSNSVLEYMAAGLVTITTNLGGSSEIIQDGVNGFLIQPMDDRRIVELVKLLKSNFKLRKTIIGRAKKTIEEKFSFQKNLKLLTQLYESV
jgi:glycosyltransferase involved in cell wall biosynthesis